MRTYAEAMEVAGTTELASYAGGRSRYVTYESDNGVVTARMFSTEIVEFQPDCIVVRTGGHVTPSTFDGIATALGISRGHTTCGTHKRVPYLLGYRMTEDMALDYNGRLIEDGRVETPEAPPRGGGHWR